VKGNRHFEEIDDYTELVSVEGVRYKKSRLGITQITFPLLLEWQNHDNRSFLSAGAVGAFKTASSSRIEYYKERRGKGKELVDRGMTLRPVSLDLLAQVGTRSWGAFIRYSPFSIFEDKKGPGLYPLTFGIMLHLK
jgi:hypothetical protein